MGEPRPAGKVRLIKLFVVTLPVLAGATDPQPPTEVFVKKSDASKRYKSLVDQLKALAKAIKGYPKFSPPGDPAPQPPIVGVVALQEYRFRRDKLQSMLAAALNRSLQPAESASLKSYSFQNPNAPKAEKADPATTPPPSPVEA